jgi:hypothetical protein
LPTQRDGVNLIYNKTLIPFASINNVQANILTAVGIGGIAPVREIYTGNAITPSDIFDLIDTANLLADFKLLSSATKINNINVTNGILVINNSNIQTISTATLGFRTYQYQFPNNIGTIIAKEVATYTYTAPTFGVGDTLTQITTHPVGGNSTGTTISLPIQTAPNKSQVKLFVESILAAANETSGTVTVTGNSTSMVITIPNSTLPFVSTTLLISATPTTTAFIKS